MAVGSLSSHAGLCCLAGRWGGRHRGGLEGLLGSSFLRRSHLLPTPIRKKELSSLWLAHNSPNLMSALQSKTPIKKYDVNSLTTVKALKDGTVPNKIQISFPSLQPEQAECVAPFLQFALQSRIDSNRWCSGVSVRAPPSLLFQ